MLEYIIIVSLGFAALGLIAFIGQFFLFLYYHFFGIKF